MQTATEIPVRRNKKSPTAHFESLVYPLMDKLYGTAVVMTRDRIDAEDLVQETYLKAYQYFHRFKSGTNFRAWIFRILVNNFINQYRRRQRQPFKVNLETVSHRLTSAEHGYTAPINAGMALDEDYGDHFDDTVTKALDKLPVKYRLVVLLCDVNDLRYKEIAQVVGCPVGTVMSRLSRGRKMLAKSLKGYAVANGFHNECG